MGFIFTFSINHKITVNLDVNILKIFEFLIHVRHLHLSFLNKIDYYINLFTYINLICINFALIRVMEI